MARGGELCHLYNDLEGIGSNKLGGYSVSNNIIVITTLTISLPAFDHFILSLNDSKITTYYVICSLKMGASP